MVVLHSVRVYCLGIVTGRGSGTARRRAPTLGHGWLACLHPQTIESSLTCNFALDSETVAKLRSSNLGRWREYRDMLATSLIHSSSSPISFAASPLTSCPWQIIWMSDLVFQRLCGVHLYLLGFYRKLDLLPPHVSDVYTSSATKRVRMTVDNVD